MIEFYLVAYYRAVRGLEYSTLKNGRHMIYTKSGFNDLESLAAGIKGEIAKFGEGVPVAPINMLPEVKKSDRSSSRLSPVEKTEVLGLVYK